MNRTTKHILPSLALLFALGCASSPPSFQAPEPPPLGRDLPRSLPDVADAAGRPSGFIESRGPLALQDALAAALTHNPRLAAYSWEVRAKEAEALQAGIPPNPELELEVENFGGGGDFKGLRASESTLALSQLVELGGKRGKRLRVAEREQGLAAWDYETARIDVLTATTKAFVAVLAAQRQLVVAGELVEVAEDVLTTVSRRVMAGSTSPIEENRARVELAISRIDQDRARHALAAARQRLAAQWGGTAPAFTVAEGALEKTFPTPSLEALWARQDQNPDLARWTAEIGHRQAVVDLENALGTVDLSLAAGVRYFNEVEGGAFILGAGLPLPFFDRNQGAAKAAALRLGRAREEQRAAVLGIRTRLAVAHEDLLAAAAEVEALRERALPEAQEAFDSAMDAYLRGAMRLIDVLDIERLLFGLRSRYYEALVQYHGTVADIERLTGESILAAADNSGRS